MDDAAYLCNAAAASAAALKSLFHTLHNPKVSRYEPTPEKKKEKQKKWAQQQRNPTVHSTSWCIYIHLLYFIWQTSSKDSHAFTSYNIFDMDY